MPELKPIPEMPFEAGKVISAGALNRMAQAIAKMITGVGGISVHWYNGKLVLSFDKTQPVVPDTSNYLMQFVVVQEYYDYLACVPFVCPAVGSYTNAPQPYQANLGQNSLNTIYVAKPYYLQATPWIGKTVSMYGTNYTITGTGIGSRLLGTQQQYITPQYMPGDIITANKAVTGYYSGQLDKYGTPTPIVFMDMNQAGRSWQTPVVVSGFSGAKYEFDTLFSIPAGSSSRIVIGTDPAVSLPAWGNPALIFDTGQTGGTYLFTGNGGVLRILNPGYYLVNFNTEIIFTGLDTAVSKQQVETLILATGGGGLALGGVIGYADRNLPNPYYNMGGVFMSVSELVKMTLPGTIQVTVNVDPDGRHTQPLGCAGYAILDVQKVG